MKGFLDHNGMAVAYGLDSFMRAYNSAQDRKLQRQQMKANQKRQGALDDLTRQQFQAQQDQIAYAQRRDQADSQVAANPGLLGSIGQVGPFQPGQGLSDMPSANMIMKARESVKPKTPEYTSGVREFMQVVGRKPQNLDEYVSFHSAKKGPGVTINNGQPTIGEKEFDKVSANEFADYVALGGYADTQKNIQQLDSVVEDIEGAIKSGKDLTGPAFGLMPRSMRAVLSQEGTDVMERVEEVVQRNLRAVLGAQFTEKEGERLIARAYNPYLDEKVNLQRVKRLVGSIKKMANAKAQAYEYFKENGSLVGFQGPTSFTMSDVEKVIGVDSDNQAEGNEGAEKTRMRYNPETGRLE